LTTDPLNSSTADDPDGFGALAENARYLIDYQWRRSASIEARGTQLLAAAAVVLALLASLLVQHVARFLLASSILLGGTALLLIASAACAVACIAPRAALGPDSTAFREIVYFGYRSAPKKRHLLEAQLVSMLVGDPGAPPLIGSLALDADKRARWLARSAWCFVAALAPLTATGTVIMWGR
jgi:hypothetical protein